LTLDKIPAYYSLSTSRKLSSLAPRRVLEKLGLGYPAMEARARKHSTEEDFETFFGEFIKLKEHDKLYSVREGSMVLKPTSGNAISVSADCRFPPRAPVGMYDIQLYVFQNEAGTLQSSTTIQLEHAGVASFVVSLAHNHGLLYGIIAVIFALSIGLLTGLIFGLGSKGGH